MGALLNCMLLLDAAERVLKSSLEIETEDEARRYFSLHFGGGKPMPVKVTYKGKPFDITVSFGSSHGFSAGGHGDKNRWFEISRAKLMDKIWDVVKTPDVITWSSTSNPPYSNKVYDKEIKELESNSYGRVVLVPKPSPEDASHGVCRNYEFASWHLPSMGQYKSSFENRYKTDPVKTRGLKK